jgi:UDPglucose--hexose-1-phosphate uridylyltransferase
VVIAPERAKRGTNLARPTMTVTPVPERDAACPFCPGNEEITGLEMHRLEGIDGKWHVRSVVNKFSVLAPEGEVGSLEAFEHARGAVNGVGLHEVIIEGPRHDLPLALQPIGQVREVVQTYVERFRAFYADPRIRHVIVFKNHGAAAGASQQHPHSQIVGLPILPGQVADRVGCAQHFFAEHGRCLACHIIAEEHEAGARIVAENSHFIAFIPYAALSPYHLWIFPKQHAACFGTASAETLDALAEMLRTVLGKVYGLLENPPFNFVVRSLGPRDAAAPHFHWYVPLIPRVNQSAGFELGTGMYINPSLPEASAQALREYQG